MKRIYAFLINAAYRDFCLWMISSRPSFRIRDRSEFILALSNFIYPKACPVTFQSFEDKFYSDYEKDSQNFGSYI